MMRASGLSERARRKIRTDQRSLQKEIAQDANLIEDVKSDAFDKFRNSNNTIFNEGVRYVREAVIDGDNLETIGRHASKQAAKLIVTSNFSSQKLISKLRSKIMKNGNVDWRLLGDAVGPCFNAVPYVQFYKGPFDEPVKAKETKAKSVRTKRRDEESEEVRPEVSERAFWKANILALKCAKWLQTFNGSIHY